MAWSEHVVPAVQIILDAKVRELITCCLLSDYVAWKQPLKLYNQSVGMNTVEKDESICNLIIALS